MTADVVDFALGSLGRHREPDWQKHHHGVTEIIIFPGVRIERRETYVQPTPLLPPPKPHPRTFADFVVGLDTALGGFSVTINYVLGRKAAIPEVIPLRIITFAGELYLPRLLKEAKDFGSSRVHVFNISRRRDEDFHLILGKEWYDPSE